ncbi:MAG TPA: hypothetical protein VGV88_06805 [Candidatus Dormibacteraeota bacterium]|nr:hypothetical protein [Candidatus Dormibacteraeota bacterium]
MTRPFPTPDADLSTVLVKAPGSQPGCWAGASTAALDDDGEFLIAYRLRTPDRRGSQVAVAKMNRALRLRTVCTLEKERFAAESLERPALVRADHGWRLYVSCATPGTKHWRVDALEAADPAALGAAQPTTVFPGSAQVGVKDPVVRRTKYGWEAWVCCHPLDEPGEEDRMTTAYATSDDGLRWRWHGADLAGRPGAWDARGARVTAVLPDGRASYDGRASKEENFLERTGVAEPGAAGALLARDGGPVANVRYLDVVTTPDAYVLFFEQPRVDGTHDLCIQRVPR